MSILLFFIDGLGIGARGPLNPFDGLEGAEPLAQFHDEELRTIHGGIVVRYGEIAPNAVVDPTLKILPEIKKGSAVKRGQVIGYITRMTGGSTMLHFECYSNSSLPGGLTDRSKSGGKFQRRQDLMDPTNLLDGAKSSLPSNPGNLDAETLKKAIASGHAKAK